jgi:hypothetical protein
MSNVVKYKLTKPNLIRLNNVLQNLQDHPFTVHEIIINGIVEEWKEKIRRKTQNDCQTVTLSFKNHEALAMVEWLKSTLKYKYQFGSIVPLYNLLEAIETQTLNP